MALRKSRTAIIAPLLVAGDWSLVGMINANLPSTINHQPALCSHSSVVAAAVTGGRSSRVLNRHNFTLKRPILCRADQASTHRIFANIIPFLRVTFGIADQVIKKSALPKGL
jgi:hypothetical protein